MLSLAADAPATTASASATSTNGIAQRDCMCPFCISTPHSEIEKRTPRERYGSASANGLPNAPSPREAPRDEPDEGHEEPDRAPVAEDDRRDDQRQEEIRKIATGPGLPRPARARIGLFRGKVS